jgi:hypothetical protein
MAGIAAPCVLGFLMSAAAAQEPCKIEPLTAEALLAALIHVGSISALSGCGSWFRPEFGRVSKAGVFRG